MKFFLREDLGEMFQIWSLLKTIDPSCSTARATTFGATVFGANRCHQETERHDRGVAGL